MIQNTNLPTTNPFASAATLNAATLSNSTLSNSTVGNSTVGSSDSSSSMAKLEKMRSPDEMQKAANDFESVFVSLMLKEMRNTLDSENGGLFAGEGSDTFGSMFDMFMGKHIAASKPLGIGNAIETYMAQTPT